MPVYAVSVSGVFIGLAGVMLFASMAALWQSLRSAFGGGPRESLDGTGALDERSALLEEKNTLLRAIKDIQFEREVGKISDEDFARLDKAYRRRAKEVLRLLDQDLGSFLGRAEKLVADAMGEEDGDAYRSGKVKRRARKSAKSKSRGNRRKAKPAKQTFECPECGAGNDFDATFCKECATRLAPVECASCGTENDPDAKFCKGCAKSLAADEPEGQDAELSAPLASADPVDGDEDAEAEDEDAEAEDAEAEDAEDGDAESADAEGAEAEDTEGVSEPDAVNEEEE